MPVLYGEGFKSALYRLQVEVFQATGDYSIFAWASSGSHWEATSLNANGLVEIQHERTKPI